MKKQMTVAQAAKRVIEQWKRHKLTPEGLSWVGLMPLDERIGDLEKAMAKINTAEWEEDEKSCQKT